ncbi:hypothetical protein ASZ90_015631 [hydrocarbon metagenome]|uniref:Uncharacterized protein n=1 Tax=hydrocarbon metagenome TaxID=938273 RepID=A0A0W8F1G0_9ZZZZ
MKWTARGEVPEVGSAVKFATGGSGIVVTVIYPGRDFVVLPRALDAVRLTV